MNKLNFELIEKITLDSDVSLLSRNVDLKGNNYYYKNLYIKVAMAKNTANSMYLYAANKDSSKIANSVIYGVMNPENILYYQILVLNIDGQLFILISTPTVSLSVPTNIQIQPYSGNTYNFNMIEQLKFQTSTTLPTGSVFEIYGSRGYEE